MEEVDLNKCYQCKTNDKLPESAFCSLACKNLYWKDSEQTSKTKPLPRTTQELVTKVAGLGKDSPHEDDPVEFMAHIVSQPIQTENLPYRD